MIFSTLITFKISLKADKINARKLSFLIGEGELEGVNTTTKEILNYYQIANVKGLKYWKFSWLLDIISLNSENPIGENDLKMKKQMHQKCLNLKKIERIPIIISY